jgi:hypothetical protein
MYAVLNKLQCLNHTPFCVTFYAAVRNQQLQAASPSLAKSTMTLVAFKTLLVPSCNVYNTLIVVCVCDTHNYLCARQMATPNHQINVQLASSLNTLKLQAVKKCAVEMRFVIKLFFNSLGEQVSVRLHFQRTHHKVFD